MEEDRAHELLFVNDVLTTKDGEVTMTEDFESLVDTYMSKVASLSSSDVADFVRERVGQADIVEPIVALSQTDPQTAAELCALYDQLDSGSGTDWLSLLPPMRLFRQTDIPIDGVPSSFIPVEPTHVPHLTKMYSPAVVYVWLDDCPPCDTMKEDLESVFERDWTVMPFAVYGPSHPEFLASEYDVTAGPVLLFMRDGAVKSRLYGAHGPDTLEAELTMLSQ